MMSMFYACPRQAPPASCPQIRHRLTPRQLSACWANPNRHDDADPPKTADAPHDVDVLDVVIPGVQGFSAIYIIGQLTPFVAVAIRGDPAAVNPADISLASLTLQISQLGLVTLLYLRAASAVPLPALRPPTLHSALLGVAAGGAALAGAGALAALSGDVGGQNTQEVGALLRCQGPAAVGMIVASTALLGPISEELVFRGVLLQGLAKCRMQRWVALAMSTAAFLAVHPNVSDWRGLVPVSLAVSAAALTPGGGVPAAILGHAMYNGAILTAVLLSNASSACPGAGG